MIEETRYRLPAIWSRPAQASALYLQSQVLRSIVVMRFAIGVYALGTTLGSARFLGLQLLAAADLLRAFLSAPRIGGCDWH
jgi:hypothetical protein